MRAKTATPPTNHARSAVRTPDSRARSQTHRISDIGPPGVPGGHSDGTGLAAFHWNAKRGHPHAAHAAFRCRSRVASADARSPARADRAARCASYRTSRPGRTGHDSGPDTRPDRTRRTDDTADRRSAAAADANASSGRASHTLAAMLTRRSSRRGVQYSMPPPPHRTRLDCPILVRKSAVHVTKPAHDLPAIYVFAP